jgi:hypothetical protein
LCSAAKALALSDCVVMMSSSFIQCDGGLSG